MLTSIKLGNFKAFGLSQTIPIRPLTLVFGPNSAGKSSFIHSLLVLHQAAVVDGNLDVHCPKLAGNSVDLGGFAEYVHRHALDGNVSWELEFESSALHGRLSDLLKKYATRLQVAMQIGLRQEERKEVRQVKNPKTGKEEDQTVPTGEFRAVGKPYLKSYEIRIDGKPVLTLSARQNRVMSIDRVDVRSPIINSPLRECFSGQSRLAGLENVSDEQLEVAVSEMLVVLSTRVDRLVPRFIGKRGLEERDEHLFRAPPEVLFYGGIFSSGRLVGAINEQFVRLMDGLLEAAHEAITQSLGRLQYLGPLRTIPPRNFTTSEAHDANWMAGGAFAWQAVKEDAQLRDKVNGWLGGKDRLRTGYRLEVRKLLDADSLSQVVSQAIYDFDIRSRSAVLVLVEEMLANSSLSPDVRDRFLTELDNRQQDRVTKEEVENFNNIEEMDSIVDDATASLPSLDQLQLIDTNTDTLVSHRDVGIGISQALPVLVSAFASKNQLIAIEQPEIHVHPKLQAELGDVFIEAALKEGGQRNTFILETHSEHLILRILRRIRETTSGSHLDDALQTGDESVLENHIPIMPQDVSVFYVSPTPEGAQIVELPITDDGDFAARWPGGFFAERFKEPALNMIKEFAIQPEVIATWIYFRELRADFEVGMGRLVSRFPKSWTREVCTLADKQNGDIHAHSIKSFVTGESHRFISARGRAYEPEQTWLENCEGCKSPEPFHAIIASENPRKVEKVLIAGEFDRSQPPFSVSHQTEVLRNPEDLADCCATLLDVCEELVLVDPYFIPSSSKCGETFRKMLAHAKRRPRNIRTIQIYTASKADESAYRKAFASNLPRGAELKIIFVDEPPEGIHARYLLTDLGGVKFDWGFDQGELHTHRNEVILLQHTRWIELRGRYVLPSDGSATITVKSEE